MWTRLIPMWEGEERNLFFYPDKYYDDFFLCNYVKKCKTKRERPLYYRTKSNLAFDFHLI